MNGERLVQVDFSAACAAFYAGEVGVVLVTEYQRSAGRGEAVVGGRRYTVSGGQISDWRCMGAHRGNEAKEGGENFRGFHGLITKGMVKRTRHLSAFNANIYNVLYAVFK